ncbi:MAG: hypothetical protein GYA57_08535 [Myxococcales bacterium]|nr:hypothetical protein [Myxococcales bacterium]
MTRISVLFALAAACGLGLPGCGGDETCRPECRAGFSCYFGVCVPVLSDAGADEAVGPDDGAPADDAAEAEGLPETTEDRDGDGVPDPIDNCPDDPNPDQADCDGDGAGDACDDDDDNDGIPDTLDDPPPPHDEDGDTIVDACDNCPELPNVPQVDGDGDRIGDACEFPGDPSRVSERLRFLSFAESAGWVSESGSWYRRDDVLGQTQPFGGANAYDNAWTGGDDVMVRTLATWTGGSDPTYRLVGVLLRAFGLPLRFYYCCADAISSRVQIWGYNGAFDLLADRPLSMEVSEGASVVVVGAARGDRLDCFVQDEHGSVLGSAEAPATASLSGGIGLRTYGATATFNFASAYR